MKTFEIDGIEFIRPERPGKDRGLSENNRFILVKNDQCLDFYMNWRGERPLEIMEVGLFQGGSMVLMDKLFKPRRLVGVDISREPIAALEEYRASRSHIKVFYGRSQDKPGTLMAARQNFPDGIDLVVDDASHLYDQTKATFSMLFPLLNPGGRYVIEDWSWSLSPNNQTDKGRWFDRPALANLVLELVLLAGHAKVIESVEVMRGLICIRKGPGALPAGAFDFAPLLRGRTLSVI